MVFEKIICPYCANYIDVDFNNSKELTINCLKCGGRFTISNDIKKDNPNDNFFEIPLSTYRIPIFPKKIPVTGGFYFRSIPYFFIKNAIKNINKNNQPIVYYAHPWEFDPDQPRIGDIRWTHYYRLRSTEIKFKKLLKDFEFTSIKEWISYA